MACLVASSQSLKTAAERHDAAMRLAVLKNDFSRYASIVTLVSKSAVACEISPLAKSAITCEMSLITCTCTPSTSAPRSLSSRVKYAAAAVSHANVATSRGVAAVSTAGARRGVARGQGQGWARKGQNGEGGVPPGCRGWRGPRRTLQRGSRRRVLPRACHTCCSPSPSLHSASLWGGWQGHDAWAHGAAPPPVGLT